MHDTQILTMGTWLKPPNCSFTQVPHYLTNNDKTTDYGDIAEVLSVKTNLPYLSVRPFSPVPDRRQAVEMFTSCNLIIFFQVTLTLTFTVRNIMAAISLWCVCSNHFFPLCFCTKNSRTAAAEPNPLKHQATSCFQIFDLFCELN